MNIENIQLSQQLFAILQIPCKKLKLKKNDDGTFKLTLNNIPNESIQHLFKSISNQTLPNDSIESILPSQTATATVTASTTDLPTLALDEPLETLNEHPTLDIAEPLETADELKLTNQDEPTKNYNSQEINQFLPIYEFHNKSNVSAINLSALKCSKHSNLFVLNEMIHSPCLLCIQQDITHVAKLCSDINQVQDFSEYKAMFPHLGERNKKTPKITHNQIVARYLGGLNQRLAMLKNKIFNSILNIFPDCTKIEYSNFSDNHPLVLNLIRHKPINLTLDLLYPSDEQSKLKLSNFIQQSSQSEHLKCINHADRLNPLIAKDLPCIFCKLLPLQIKYDAKIVTKKNYINNNPKFHSDTQERKDKLNKVRANHTKEVNKAKELINCVLPNFHKILPNINYENSQFKITPNTVTYMTNDDQLITMSIDQIYQKSTSNE